MDPLFLDYDLILDIHEESIEKCGGSHGIRDDGLLQSAIAQPKSGFGKQFAHKDIFEMAAAYLFHITSNHPFIDGNKRVGYNSALYFLRLNGYRIKANPDEAYNMVISVAKGGLQKPEIADFFRKHRTEELDV